MTEVATEPRIAGQSLGRAARLLRTVLTSRAIMALRRSVRDLLWISRGLLVKNPPLPLNVKSILFVCLGNVCRSPFAEKLTARRVACRHPELQCTSAGISTNKDRRSPKDACEAASTFGLDLNQHRAQPLTRELMERHDLVVVMEADQLVALRGFYPDLSTRIVLLSLFDDEAAPGYERFNIADPFMQPRGAYELCYLRIARALTGLLSRLGLGIREVD